MLDESRTRMLHLLAFVWLLVLPCAVLAAPPRSQQLLVVTTPTWTGVRGEAQRYERAGRGPWRKVGTPMAALVGRRGLAWGQGLHAVPADAARLKREGDGCAPAGLFALGGAFGRAPQRALAPLRVPYFQLRSTHVAVDDPASRFYNQIVDRHEVRAPDWNSAEQMAEIPGYELGVVIAHNPQRRPGAGSCIFLHAWLGERGGSAGCTLLRPAELREVVCWLDATRAPLLMQLPREEMQRLGLPR